jgi:hypothetical protein
MKKDNGGPSILWSNGAALLLARTITRDRRLLQSRIPYTQNMFVNLRLLIDKSSIFSVLIMILPDIRNLMQCNNPQLWLNYVLAKEMMYKRKMRHR